MIPATIGIDAKRSKLKQDKKNETKKLSIILYFSLFMCLCVFILCLITMSLLHSQ